MASKEVYDAWFAAVKKADKADLKAGERLLDEHKGTLDINAVDPVYDRTALGWACYRGHSEYAAMLILRGADIKKFSNDPDRRPLRTACGEGHADCAHLLLNAGADINEADKDGRTALHFA